ncbi:hypothetical protein [Labrys neptuniae]
MSMQSSATGLLTYQQVVKGLEDIVRHCTDRAAVHAAVAVLQEMGKIDAPQPRTYVVDIFHATDTIEDEAVCFSSDPGARYGPCDAWYNYEIAKKYAMTGTLELIGRKPADVLKEARLYTQHGEYRDIRPMARATTTGDIIVVSDAMTELQLLIAVVDRKGFFDLRETKFH